MCSALYPWTPQRCSKAAYVDDRSLIAVHSATVEQAITDVAHDHEVTRQLDAAVGFVENAGKT